MSALSSFKLFDLIKNVAIDGMHGIYGGITKMLLGLWLDTKHHKMPCVSCHYYNHIHCIIT